MRAAFLLLFFFLLLNLPTAQSAPNDVDVALVLVVDTSGSIMQDEYELQRSGLADALSDDAIIQAITDNSLGRIALSLVQFSNNAATRIPWTIIDGKESALAFAALVRSTDLHEQGMTSISSGLDLATSMIATMPYRATRRVIDVSGDGMENMTAPDLTLNLLRARAKELNIVINGLPIHDDDEDVEGFYKCCVISEHVGFLIPAKDLRSFGQAMRRKLILEIG